MSDSDISAGSRVESSNSEAKVIRSKVKKHRLKRKGKLLQITPTENELKYRKNFEKFNAVNDLYDWIICTNCQTSFKQDILEGKEIHSHPLLQVLMCKSCCEYYGDGEFSLDEDDEDKYCRWCGEGGKLFLCSKCICGFCPNCIRKHFGARKVTEIKRDDDWVCYLCNPEPLWKLRSICQLAQKESESNRKERKAANSTEKSSSRGRKYLDQNEEAVKSKQNDTESCKNDTYAENESDRSSRYIRRNRGFHNRSKSRDNISRSSDQNDNTNGEPIHKKRKLTRNSVKVGTGFINGNEQKKQKSRKSSWSDSMEYSSESEEDMDDNVNETEGEETSVFEKNHNAEKLKEILKIAEITSQLCFKLCKKEVKKLNRRNNVITNEKLISNCENLKSMIILMSSSLSTVHSMILSLQKKFGNKGADDVFGGGDGTSLLKTISHILMDKRVKTSHIVSVVNDILNRYPFIELGAALLRDSVCENNIQSMNIKSGLDLDGQENYVISQSGLCELETSEHRVNDSQNNDLKSSGCVSGCPQKVSSKGTSTERLQCNNDVSTDISDIFESENRSDVGSDKRENNQTTVSDGKNGVSNSAESERKDNASDFDVDMKKVYENSLKLKEQLLKDSSDETSDKDSETSDSSTDDDLRTRRTKGQKVKRNARTKKNNLSEDRELRRLTNLKSLDRRRTESQDSGSGTSSEGSSQNQLHSDKKSKQADEGSSSDSIPLGTDDGCSYDEIQLPRPSNEIEFLKHCSSLLKEYILDTTSSESEVDHNLEKDTGKPKTKDASKARLKPSDMWTSTSDDESGKRETERKRVRKRSKSDFSVSTDNSSDSYSPKWRKRKRKPLKLTDSDSSCKVSERPAKSDTESPKKGRRTIRKILKKDNLQLETRQAIKIENERKKRIAERNECYKKFFPDMPNSSRLVLDFDHETGEVLVEVPKDIVKHLKPHQKEGIKFMWDNCFESLTCLEENSGSGCILAHCMGLGKTLQVIALVATLMKSNLGVDTVIILCPLNVVNNWVQEFDLWLENVDIDIDIYNIIRYKKADERYHHIRQWHKKGGVLVLSYDMFRVLTTLPKKRKTESQPTPRVFDHLLDPGPDLIVCDEGHLMKNEDTSLSRAVSKIKTARRIILTGTPFQNNLLEYHSMVHFIKPNILGTRKEFINRFANPIRNGQFEDSTASDVKLMQARAHVLHKLLDGCIQRFDYSVLTPFLPEKHEYVISVRLTETQAKLYRYYLEKCKKITMTEKGTKLFSDFHWLQKIWTHPELVRLHMEERVAGNDRQNGVESSTDESVICIEDDGIDESYWKTVVKPEEYEDIRSSGKLLLLFDILARCRRIGDKVLVFSQSLKNLNLIENYLHEVHKARNRGRSEDNKCAGIPSEFLDTWVMGHDYFRLDGSTANDTRSKWCKWFNNKKNNRARLFLISTKAGGLGINLIGANRVVIFDASWNPSHDVQSIFRVYRFGQKKTCYIYRFVAEATMEEKIYKRQVTKLSLEKRVLDEHQIERHYTMGNLQELYQFDPLPKDKWPVPIVPKDLILADVLKVRRDMIVTYHEHDSLLENIEEEELTEEERKAAWEDFEKEKFMIEHQLERKTFGIPRDQQTIDELTKEVLQITGLYRTTGSGVPYFTPSFPHGSGKNMPFRIVNVQSLGTNFPGARTSQDVGPRDFP